MISKKFSLLFFLILFGCSQNIITNNKKDFSSSDVLKLNVEELNILFIENEKEKKRSEFLNENIYQIRKSAISKLRYWSSLQFSVLGKRNKSTLKIIIPNIKIKEEDTSKGLKKILANKKETYLFRTDLNLIFIIEDGIKKKIDIKSEIEIILEDNYSINQRKNKIEESINTLIDAINIELKKQLVKDNFRSLVL